MGGRATAVACHTQESSLACHMTADAATRYPHLLTYSLPPSLSLSPSHPLVFPLRKLFKN